MLIATKEFVESVPSGFSPDLATVALGYHRKGWAVIDLPIRSKYPTRERWQHERWDEREIQDRFSKGPANIGVILGEASGGLVDVDLDCDEAIRLAARYLPPTEAIFGRRSKPKSHWLYYTDPAPETVKCIDPNATEGDEHATLIELRISGQTVFPSSVHKEGECIRWDCEGEPARVRGEVLSSQVKRIGAASLLARNWKKGKRHAAALALAGGLFKAQWDQTDVEDFIKAVAWAAGDDEVEDRVRAVEDTANKRYSGDQTTGWPSLAEIVGEQVVRKVREWLGIEDRPLEESKSVAEAAAQQDTTKTLLSLAEDGEYFKDLLGNPYARVRVSEHFETHRIDGAEFRRWLRLRSWDSTNSTPSKDSLDRSIEQLGARAEFGEEERPVFLRVGEYQGSLYVDLGTKDWSVAKISKAGWEVIPSSESPVCFRRTPRMQALPMPERSGCLKKLADHVNVEIESDEWRLIVAWLLSAYHAEGPYPLLVLTGEKGCGKSTLSKILRRLTDPATPVSGGKLGRDDEIRANAANNRVLVYDNLSSLSVSQSDSLCRISSEGGFLTRQYYSTSNEDAIQARRPVILTAIGSVVSQPDLLDRSLVVQLPVIEGGWGDDNELWQAFEEDAGSILGGLFDAVVKALERLPKIKKKQPVRMAAFARWVQAAEPALPWGEGEFLSSYRKHRDESAFVALESSPVIQEFISFMRESIEWEGTMGRLKEVLELRAQITLSPSRGWVSSPKDLSNVLRKHASALRDLGITWETGVRKSDGQHYQFAWYDALRQKPERDVVTID